MAKPVARLLLVVASVVASLGAVELLLIATDSLPPDDAAPVQLPGQTDHVDALTRRDERLLFTLNPGARTFDWCAIDAHGYRTPPFDDEKPAGCFRLVTTGDSSTFGVSVLEDQHWSSVLRRALTGLCAGVRRVEVVDAGVFRYSTLQNRLQIERDLLPLQPDLIAWLVTGVNDATRVEGPGDAEQIAAQASPLRRLAHLRLARLLGLDRHAWCDISPDAEPGSPTARPRVTLDEAEDNLRAVADRLEARLLVGVFPSQPGYREVESTAALTARAVALAEERRLPLADLRPVVAALSPYPLYLDGVHPNPLGHRLIARTVLDAVLPQIELPAERAAWIAAWQRALAGELPAVAATLRGPGAPPRFVQYAALYRDTREIEARLAEGDPSLPTIVAAWDPIQGRRCREWSRALLLLDDADAARAAEIERCVRPRDPALACFADDAAFLAADDETRGLMRALLAFTADLGLVPVRADMRRGQALLTETPAAGIELLQAAVALAPSDAEARYDLATALRRAGRHDEAREEWMQLALGVGPLSDFARGLLAGQDGRQDEGEQQLRRAVAGRPSFGYAHVLLGRVLLERDRLDEAMREFALAAGMIGAHDDLPALMARVQARREELAAPGERDELSAVETR